MNNIDPTLTVKAPYRQGDITIFAANAGQQCIFTSLCAFIYNNIKGINTCNDLVQLMEINCILHCHNVQGRCISCKQNYHL